MAMTESSFSFSTGQPTTLSSSSRTLTLNFELLSLCLPGCCVEYLSCDLLSNPFGSFAIGSFLTKNVVTVRLEEDSSGDAAREPAHDYSLCARAGSGEDQAGGAGEEDCG